MSLAEGDDLDVIWQRIQTTIKTIENWCQCKGLNISALKTKIIMSTWNRKWTLRPIEVCGETMELSNEVKLLGITLDSKLTFNTHIDNITKKCIGTLFQCERAIGPTGGLSPKVCHWIYTSIIRPTLAYCSIVYAALNNLTGTPRITGYLRGEAAKRAVRLISQGDWTLETVPSGKGIIKAHSTISNNFLHTLNINKHDSWDITKP